MNRTEAHPIELAILLAVLVIEAFLMLVIAAVALVLVLVSPRLLTVTMSQLQEAVKGKPGAPVGNQNASKGNNPPRCGGLNDPTTGANHQPTDRKSRLIRYHEGFFPRRRGQHHHLPHLRRHWPGPRHIRWLRSPWSWRPCPQRPCERWLAPDPSATRNAS
jgi:hypothetical protein